MNVVESYLFVPSQLGLPKHYLHPTFAYRIEVEGYLN